MQLSNEERLKIAQRVVDKAAGRVPVVAGGVPIMNYITWNCDSVSALCFHIPISIVLC